jgi:hypothetical protein
MVKHIVLWALKEEEKKNCDRIVEDLNQRFHALLGVVDGLTSIEVGRNYNGGKFDVVFYCQLATKEAESNYQSHPAHIAIKEIIHGLVCGRECVDYEI